MLSTEEAKEAGVEYTWSTGVEYTVVYTMIMTSTPPARHRAASSTADPAFQSSKCAALSACNTLRMPGASKGMSLCQTKPIPGIKVALGREVEATAPVELSA